MSNLIAEYDQEPAKLLRAFPDRSPGVTLLRKRALLRSIFVNHLAKISLLVKQPDANHWYAQIASSFELVTGHIPQSSGALRSA